MSVAVVDQGGAQAEEVGLKRVLRTRDLVLFGVTMMFPLAPIAVYLDVTSATGGHMAVAYVVAMVGDAVHRPQLRRDGRRISQGWLHLHVHPQRPQSVPRAARRLGDHARLPALPDPQLHHHRVFAQQLRTVGLSSAAGLLALGHRRDRHRDLLQPSRGQVAGPRLGHPRSSSASSSSPGSSSPRSARSTAEPAKPRSSPPSRSSAMA